MRALHQTNFILSRGLRPRVFWKLAHLTLGIACTGFGANPSLLPTANAAPAVEPEPLAGLTPEAIAEVPLSKIKLPPGFEIELFANNIPGARSLALSPSGTLYIGTRDGGTITALSKGKLYTIAKDLNSPNGVAFKDGKLYAAETSRILRFDAIETHLSDPPKPVLVNDRLPKERHHGWKFIAFGPDGKLYVPVGAPCNVCEREDERFSKIMRMNPDGSELEVFARGVRNSVGFDWHPKTRELWFTENGRDMMGDDTPPDELNRAPKAGLHFGFPYCHAGRILDPQFGKKKSCESYQKPEQELGPHVAALGMRFYAQQAFPEAYRGRIFIAEHGSWNRSKPIGYRLMTVKLPAGSPESYETFAEGWLQGSTPWGRPVDVLVTPQGALLVSDDLGGRIYRIRFTAKR
jgi:glucose/arabinose dehydrogenase